MKRQLLLTIFSCLSVWAFAGADPSSDASKSKNDLLPPMTITGIVNRDTCMLGLGSIDITVTDGTPPYTYLWSNGAITEDISGLVGSWNNYTVTVTDATGATQEMSFLVIDYNIFYLGEFHFFDYFTYAYSDNTSCTNQPNAFVEVGNLTNFPFTWLWPDGYTEATRYDLTSGFYIITVTLGATCEFHFSQNILDSPDLPVLAATPTEPTCSLPNGSIDLTITESEPPYIIEWSNGAMTEDLSNLAPGTYTVTVTGANGCSEVESYTIEDQPAFMLSGDVEVTSSCAAPNGAIDLTPSPPGSYTYAWSNGASIEDLANLTAGGYTVTVTDATGCSTTAQFTVGSTALPPTLAAAATSLTCGLGSGSVDLTASGGTAPYTYNWSNGASSEDLSGVPAATYTVTVTGANGCSATASATVADNPIPINISGTTMPAPNGLVDITASPTNAYSYAWSNGATTEDINNLSAGTYTVTVTLGTGCTATGSFVVGSPPLLEITGIITSDSCSNGTGAIDISLNGGTPPYTFSWSNGAVFEDLSSLAQGTYTVTVTDADGTTATASFTVNNVTFTPEIIPTVGPDSICWDFQGSGSISLEIMPPGNYTYNWSNGASGPYLQNLDADFDLNSPQYIVTVSTGAGCTNSMTIIVPALDNNYPGFNYDMITNPTCGLNNGSIEMDVHEPHCPCTSQWSNGETTEDVYNLAPGNYHVTITITSTGCNSIAGIDIVNEEPPISLDGTVTPNTLCGTGNGSITVVPSSTLTGPFVFSWSNGGTEDTVDDLLPGTYMVTVTYGDCSATESFIVPDIPTPPEISLSMQSDICGQGSGQVSSSTESGIPPYSYLWSNGSTASGLDDVTSDTYLVTVTDAAGCKDYASIEVIDVDVPFTVEGVVTPSSSCNVPNGSILTTVSPAFNYTFLWSNGATTPDLVNQPAGAYSVTVTSQGTCSEMATFTVAGTLAADTIWLSAYTCDLAGAGTFTETFMGQGGCDSVVVTLVSYIAADTTSISGTSCDINEVGVFEQTLTNGNGCDSLVITTITYSATDTTALFDTSCDINDVGVFEQTLTNGNGCDSLIITTITYAAADTTSIFDTSCDVNDVGVFVQALTNINGCDSLIITTIIYAAADTTSIFDTSCDINDVGVFEETLTNNNGCDSLVITTITYAAADTTTLFDTSCDVSQVGVFEQTLTNGNGCDSLIITTITYAAADTTSIFDTSCDVNDVGVFEQTLTNGNGCDSLIITTITYSVADTTSIFDTSCDVNDVGVFEQTLTNGNGCDSLIITTIAYAAADTTNISDTSCDINSVGVFEQTLTNGNGCDSLIITTITYAAADTTNISGTSCDINSVGVFEETLVNSNGCDSVVITTVTLLPSTTTTLTATTCDPTQAGVFIQSLNTWQGCDSTVTTTVTLLPSATTMLSATTCDPIQAGVFVQNLSTWQGCDSTVTTTVALLPDATTNLSSTTCDAAQAGVFIQNLSTWQGCDSIVTTTVALLPDVTTSIAANTCDAAQAGVFIQNLTTWQGCDSTVTTTVTWTPPPTLTLAASDFSGFGTSCAGASDGWAQASATGVPPFGFVWADGTQATLLEGLAPGVYPVTVTDGNGCTSEGSVEITGPELLANSLTINGLGCFDDNSGAVTAAASGGVPPYLFSINGGASQPTGLFGGLGAGAYQITVQDANGCSATDLVAISAPVPLSVELGDDVFLELGDGTALSALVNVPLDSLAQINWSGLGNLECPQCPQQQVFPVVTTAYTVTVSDAQGCIASDGVTVYVDRTKNVYVPNAFSPDGDGINDLLLVFAKEGQVKKVKSFLVFDRWGESVFRYHDFQPNDPAVGWDGTHRGQLLDAAVFVWFAEVEFMDGEVELFEGDVVLMR